LLFADFFMSKKPKVPLTKSALLAEMERIQKAIMCSLLENPNRIKTLEQELKELVEYVEENKGKIIEG